MRQFVAFALGVGVALIPLALKFSTGLPITYQDSSETFKNIQLPALPSITELPEDSKTFYEMLETAVHLFRGPQARHSLPLVKSILDQCVPKISSRSEADQLANVSHILPLWEDQLLLLAKQIENSLEVGSSGAWLLSWRSQHDAEIIFSGFSEDRRMALIISGTFAKECFGEKAGAIVSRTLENRDLKFLSSEQMRSLLGQGVLSAVSLEKILHAQVAEKSPEMRSQYLTTICDWLPQLKRGRIELIWSRLCHVFSAEELAVHARQVARLGSPELPLQSFGESFARSPFAVQEFSTEMKSWHSEAARRPLLQGFLSTVAELTPEQASVLRSGTDDLGMLVAIDIKMLQGQVTKEGPQAMSGFNIGPEEKTKIALQSMETWPDATISMALDGLLDVQDISAQWLSSPEKYPLNEKTSLRLSQWLKTHPKQDSP